MADQGNSHRTKREDLMKLVKGSLICCDKTKDHIIASILWQNAGIKPVFSLPPPAQGGGDLENHPPNMSNPPRMYGKNQQYNRLNQDELYNEVYKRISGIKKIESQLPHVGNPRSIRTQDVLDHQGVLSLLTKVKAKDPLVAVCIWLDIHHVPSSEYMAGRLKHPMNDTNHILWSDSHLQRCIERLPVTQVNRDKDGYLLYILHGIKKIFQKCETTSDPAFMKLFHYAPARETRVIPPPGTLEEFGGGPGTPKGGGWFNKLPIELRKTIWELVLEEVGPRTIQPYNIRGVVKVNCHPPALFHINHESRQIITSRFAGYQCFRPTQNFPRDLVLKIDDDDEDDDDDDDEQDLMDEDCVGIEEYEDDDIDIVSDDEDVKDTPMVPDVPNVPNREFPPGNKAAGGIWFNPEKDTLYLGRRTFALAGEVLTTGAIRAQMPAFLGAVKHLALYLMSRSLWRITDQTQFMEDLVQFSGVETLTGVVWDEYLSFEPFTSVLETQLTMIVDYNKMDTTVDPNKKGVVVGVVSSPGFDGENRDKYINYLNNIRDSWDRAEDNRVSRWNEDHPASNITSRSGILKFAIAAATAHRPRNVEADVDDLSNAAGNLALKDEDDDELKNKNIESEDEDRMEGVEAFTADHSVPGCASRGATIEPTPAPPDSVRRFDDPSPAGAMYTDRKDTMGQNKIVKLEENLRTEREEKEEFKNALESEKKKREAENTERINLDARIANLEAIVQTQREAERREREAERREREAERQERLDLMAALKLLTENKEKK